MSSNLDLLKGGGYAAKQVFAKFRILRWSHQSRFNKGIGLVKKIRPKSILDYGCGDATFLIFLRSLVNIKFGMEIDTTQIDLLKIRFEKESGFTFLHVSEDPGQKFEMVTCFEVLEHCNDEDIAIILEKLNQLCCQDGTIIISVPKETGLTMIGKQAIRRFLGMIKFGNYQYSEWYTFVEFFKMLFATENTKIKRAFYEVSFEGKASQACSHKGFNWKVLRLIIQSKFDLQKIEFTPQILPLGLVSSQVWFICRKK